jgi:cell division transport system permease protein
MTSPTARTLDQARVGRPMVWVIAIMLFLTILAAAAGIGTARAAATLGTRIAARATVQVAAADPATRAAQAARALAALRASSAVTRAEAVPRAELTRLLGPWLGEEADDADLPVPALIDIELADGAASLPAVRRALATAAPLAQVTAQGEALAPVSRLLGTATLLAAAVVALMAGATAAVVVLATRAGLEAHRPTIDVMHALGATDVQVARLFQRRIARDAALGALAGGIAALAVVAGLGWQLSAAGSELLGGATLGDAGWAALFLLPFAFVLLAALVARGAVTRTLATSL